MNTELDITKLISKTQDFIHDGMIEFAASGSTPIQDIKIGDDTYELRVSLSIKKEEDNTTTEVHEYRSAVERLLSMLNDHYGELPKLVEKRLDDVNAFYEEKP